MMGDVIPLGDHRPHGTHYVVCMDCAKDWVAVVPETAEWPLECPNCGEMSGDEVNWNDAEWFMRFMAGGDSEKRTLVLLNAKRMEDI
jgi:DNA-directed RNA polymerase subunit RPC12/RpoP